MRKLINFLTKSIMRTHRQEPVEQRCHGCGMSFDSDGALSWHARHTAHELDCDQEGPCLCDVALHPDCCWECNDCAKCGRTPTSALVFEYWPLVFTCDDHYEELRDHELANGEQLWTVLTLRVRTG